MAERGSTIRFGLFEADLRTGELRKGGVKLRLSEQPFQILAALLEKSGELVTREELKDKLWPEETFVEFDDSLNTAVNKLRQSLGDSARKPKYIETLAGRGYRFVGEIDQPAETAPAVRPSPVGSVLKGWWSHGSSAQFMAGAGLALVAVWWLFPNSTPPLQRQSFERTVPEGQSIITNLYDTLAISPDGGKIGYIGEDATGERAVYLWPLDSFEPKRLEGTESAEMLFFSPDGEWVGFHASGQLRKAPIGDGPTVKIADTPRSTYSASWGGNGWIVFHGQFVERVPATGGQPELWPEAEQTPFNSAHFLWLPGADQALWARAGDPTSRGIGLFDAGSGNRKVVLTGIESRRAYYSSSGHLVYGEERTLMAVPCDLATGEITGPALPVANDVHRDPSEGTRDFVVSESGTIAYLVGEPKLQELVWIDRSGQIEAAALDPRGFAFGLSISPDGTKVATGSVEGFERHIWIHDLQRGSSERLTSDGANRSPVWSADGTRVAFQSDFPADGKQRIRWRPVDSSTPSQEWSVRQGVARPHSWTKDGTLLFNETSADGGGDIWMLPHNGEAQAWLATPARERQPRVEPSRGRLIAYTSDKSGRDEVYVQAFPEPTGFRLVSNRGGHAPRWSRDGSELFYLKGDRMMAASLLSEQPPSFSRPRELFPLEGDYDPQYDVAADGRFLFNREKETPPVRQIRVIQNWVADLDGKGGAE